MVPHWLPKNELKDLGKFRNFHKLSEGGHGELYAAELKPPGTSEYRKIVIKRLKPTYSEIDAIRKKAFLNEARILKDLAHPGIPRYIDGFVSEEDCFFIIEFIPGIDISKIIYHAHLAKAPPSLHLAFHVMTRLCDLMDYLHGFRQRDGAATPIIHGDIKPRNIMIQDDLAVKLIDFSTVVVLDGERKFVGGSIAFEPLEFFTGGQPSPQSDIYSACATFFSLLTFEFLIRNKRKKFDAFSEVLGNWNLAHVKERKFPECVEALLLKGLAQNPEDRFGNALELKASLQHCETLLGMDGEDKAVLSVQLSSLKQVC